MTSKPKPIAHPEFSSGQLPGVPWAAYGRRIPQMALRIDGPFYVHTGANSGKTFCEDGYLLIRGAKVFPMAKAEFEATFLEIPSLLSDEYSE